jgi:DNA phosphorothioation-dependent restriction protein DptG
MYRYIKASISIEDVDRYAHNIFNDVMNMVNHDDARNHNIDKEIRDLVIQEIPNVSEDDIEKVVDMVYENIDSYYSRGFGAVEAKKYGDLIYRTYKGQEISKAIAKAKQPGGLTYSANKIGLSTFQLLKALEGMCADGRATYVDDSTYYVGEY